MSRARALPVLLVAALAAAVPATAPAAAKTKADPTNVPAGVTAGGVDLSGLTLADAQAKLDATIGPKVSADLVLGASGKPWTLKAADAKLVFDSLTTAKRAIRAKAPGDVGLKLSHSHAAVKAWVAGVAGKVAKPAKDARVKIALTHIYRTRATHGRALDTAKVERDVNAALDDGVNAPRTLHAKLKKTSPAVNANDLAKKYNTIITVDKAHFKLRLFKNLKFKKSYMVAVGQPAYPTPSGLFAIQNKQVDPVWSVPNSPWAGELQGTTVEGGSAANPLKSRWMGIVNGVGIHGTGEDYSIGSAASHGCIRMHVPDVKDLFSRTPVGTPVLIK
ncbi:MAG TPA: L,D-transpeptidase family protein [Baekduia sp.]|uniref:L,D-transpeptidase family protein n=1 Tax=Baekduia sp. TaxID=2600305 RepID=UPI002D79CCAD|nr:L,D-transpeptidase family protein [Baekduia sp.]HET6505463.1 L,D-transpeptidase family protein [Baekduia sp.]